MAVIRRWCWRHGCAVVLLSPCWRLSSLTSASDVTRPGSRPHSGVIYWRQKPFSLFFLFVALAISLPYYLVWTDFFFYHLIGFYLHSRACAHIRTFIVCEYGWVSVDRLRAGRLMDGERAKSTECFFLSADDRKEKSKPVLIPVSSTMSALSAAAHWHPAWSQHQYTVALLPQTQIVQRLFLAPGYCGMCYL